KFTQHRKVKTRIRQLETQEILPINARADCLCCLAIGQVFAELHDRDQREAPRREAGLAIYGEDSGKVLVLKDPSEGISEGEIRMACGKGGAGDTGGFFRHRHDDVRVERHARYPSAAWVQASERSGAVLCHSLLLRSILQVRNRIACIFHY